MMNLPSDQELHEYAAVFGKKLLDSRMKLASAESCTGGWLAKVATEVPGGSDVGDDAFRC